MEDVGNMEARSSTTLKQKKPNFDLQGLLMAADSPWHDKSRFNLQKGSDREMGYGKWVDKIMVNKLESGIVDDDSLRDWERDGGQLPNFFYQRSLPNIRKESQEFELQRSRFDSDSDDLEIANK